MYFILHLQLTRKGGNRDIISLGSCLLSLSQCYRNSVPLEVWWPKVWEFLIALLKGANLVCNKTHTLQHLFCVTHLDTLMLNPHLEYRLDHLVVPWIWNGWENRQKVLSTMFNELKYWDIFFLNSKKERLQQGKNIFIIKFSCLFYCAKPLDQWKCTYQQIKMYYMYILQYAMNRAYKYINLSKGNLRVDTFPNYTTR